jgi:anaerobic selenocysteine-containing dehydrogenase
MKLIVVDPRKTPTTARADIHLQLKPGTDGALALAMAHVIIEEALYDRQFIERWAHGFDEYRAYVKEWTPQRGESVTGVPAEAIAAAARLFATTAPASIMPSASPVVHHTNGVQNYRAVFMLLGLTGNYDVRGGNLVNPPSFVYQTGNVPTREHEFEHPVPIGASRPASAPTSSPSGWTWPTPRPRR